LPVLVQSQSRKAISGVSSAKTPRSAKVFHQPRGPFFDR
jgi:hypothetical protein